VAEKVRGCLFEKD